MLGPEVPESPLASFSISASSVNLIKKQERRRGSSERKEVSSLLGPCWPQRSVGKYPTDAQSYS